MYARWYKHMTRIGTPTPLRRERLTRVKSAATGTITARVVHLRCLATEAKATAGIIGGEPQTDEYKPQSTRVAHLQDGIKHRGATM